MNNKIKLAVAGAVLSAASVANAGIIIPAGDWTIDINGNVNAFANWTSNDNHAQEVSTGGLATNQDVTGEDNNQGINTGLLPAWLGFTGTTRQNDLDVSFTISFQPNVSDNTPLGMGDQAVPLNRQAFITFGDKFLLISCNLIASIFFDFSLSISLLIFSSSIFSSFIIKFLSSCPCFG